MTPRKELEAALEADDQWGKADVIAVGKETLRSLLASEARMRAGLMQAAIELRDASKIIADAYPNTGSIFAKASTIARSLALEESHEG